MSDLERSALGRDDLQRDGLEWLSVHLHFSGNIYRTEADRLLLDWVVPLADACVAAGEARDWFFIRYAANGSHLRLRLATSAETTEDCRRRIDAASRRGVEMAFQADDASLLALHWVDYEPEVQRYGGEHAIPVAEDLFCASSSIAVDLLRKMTEMAEMKTEGEDRSSRLGKACLAMLVQLYVFLHDAERAARLSQSYGTNYLSQMVGDDAVAARFLRAFESGRHRQAAGLADYVAAVWGALREGSALTPEMDRYRQILEGTRRRLLDLSGSRAAGVSLGGPGGCERRSTSPWMCSPPFFPATST